MTVTAREYEPGFTVTANDVGHVVGDIRFLGVRNALRFGVVCLPFAVAGVAGTAALDNHLDAAYDEALARERAEKTAVVAAATDRFNDSQARMVETTDFFSGAPACLELLMRYAPGGESETGDSAVDLVEISEEVDAIGVCGTNATLNNLLGWARMVDYNVGSLQNDEAALLEEQSHDPASDVDEATRNSAKSNFEFFSVPAAAIGAAGLVAVGGRRKIKLTEEKVATKRLSRYLRRNLDSTRPLFDRTPVLDRRKTNSDAKQVLELYKTPHTKKPHS